MILLWLKAFHIAAAVTWVGGMLMLSLLLLALRGSLGAYLPAERQLIAAVRRWDRLVTTPAMISVWALGIGMAQYAGWFGAPWLSLKLVLVLMLSALHGVQSGLLRHLFERAPRQQPAYLRHAGSLTIAAGTGIALLAVTKPFQGIG